jgi:hypothetical protein
MADFSLSSLIGADFSTSQNMQGINFINADLRGVRLNGAHLEGASLQRANLDGAILSGASLVAAEFEDTQLQAASLIAEPFPPKPGLPNDSYDPADFSLAHLHRTWLGLSDMGGANLKDAKVSDAFLWGTRNIDCSQAFVSLPDSSNRIKPIFDPDPRGVTSSRPLGSGVEATHAALSELQYDLGSTAERPLRNLFKAAGRESLNQNCLDNSGTRTYDPAAFGKLIADRICDAPQGSIIEINRREVAAGIVRNALDPFGKAKELSYIGMLAERFFQCLPSDSFDPHDVAKLKEKLDRYREQRR